ncbi:MAG: hypothetical protein O3B09_00325, partial [Proteobacteria bacterium]|nr:hypothetical protein [Pseudomonadota bacterium]
SISEEHIKDIKSLITEVKKITSLKEREYNVELLAGKYGVTLEKEELLKHFILSDHSFVVADKDEQGSVKKQNIFMLLVDLIDHNNDDLSNYVKIVQDEKEQDPILKSCIECSADWSVLKKFIQAGAYKSKDIFKWMEAVPDIKTKFGIAKYDVTNYLGSIIENAVRDDGDMAILLSLIDTEFHQDDHKYARKELLRYAMESGCSVEVTDKIAGIFLSKNDVSQLIDGLITDGSKYRKHEHNKEKAEEKEQLDIIEKQRREDKEQEQEQKRRKALDEESQPISQPQQKNIRPSRISEVISIPRDHKRNSDVGFKDYESRKTLELYRRDFGQEVTEAYIGMKGYGEEYNANSGKTIESGSEELQSSPIPNPRAVESSNHSAVGAVKTSARVLKRKREDGYKDLLYIRRVCVSVMCEKIFESMLGVGNQRDLGFLGSDDVTQQEINNIKQDAVDTIFKDSDPKDPEVQQKKSLYTATVSMLDPNNMKEIIDKKLDSWSVSKEGLMRSVDIGISKSDDGWEVTEASDKSGFNVGQVIDKIEIDGEWLSASQLSFAQMQKAFATKNDTNYIITGEEDQRACTSDNKELFHRDGTKFIPKRDVHGKLLDDLCKSLEPKSKTQVRSVRRKVDGAEFGKDGGNFNPPTSSRVA